MPGEIAESLWIANKSAFISAKKHMQQGKGSTAKLIEMGRRRTETNQEEEMYLKYAGKKSWKMKAVSFIHFMLCYYPDNKSGDVNDAIKACSEAWALMDFVESSDTEANLASLAADKEFDTLQNIWNKRLKMKPTQSKPVRTIRDRMIEDTKSRIRNGENQESEDTEQDSMDWITAAANFSLYKTRQVIDSKEIDLESANAIDSLRSLMANVIVNCLENELNNALIEKCNKWALGGKEQEIYHAAFIAGKAMYVSDLLQTSEGNGAVPIAVAEGNGNNASEGEADGEHNESSDAEIKEESEENNS